MPDIEKYERVNTTLPPSIVEGLDRVAAEVGSPGNRSAAIRFLVRNYLQGKEIKIPKKSRKRA